MKFTSLLLSLIFMLTVFDVMADGLVVDKVYHPYVLPNEREIEWRFVYRDTHETNLLQHRLGMGHSVSEYISVEGYLIGQRDTGDNFDLQSYELEARWMLTDQGKYWADLGLLFEMEKEYNEDNWVASAALLAEKEFGRTSLTINTFVVYEWGNTIDSEIESEFRLQYRYRFKPQLQPAVEIYTGENYQGIGPAVVGLQRFDGQNQLKWEAGYIFGIGLGNDNDDDTFRIALEYEF